MPIRMNLWRKFLRLAMLLSLLATVPGSIAGASARDEITWQIEIKTAFTIEQMKQPGWEENARALQAALTTRLQNNGTRLEMTRAAKANGAELSFRANGKGTAAQFRRVAFDDLSPVGGLIGGPAALTLNGAVRRDESVALVLESNLSTGYSWQATPNEAGGLRASGPAQFRQKANMPGAPATQTIALNATQDENASLALVYRRTWETQEPTRVMTLTAPRLASLAEITNPIVPPTTSAPNFPVRAPENTTALPGTFNWASSDNYLGASKVTPIRNQGGCGSCWAFASVGVFESNILIKDNVSRDLSEQFLVSCNTDGWGCGGGWWGHKYHYNTTIPNDPNPGAVYESSFPYVASDVACNAPYDRPYRLNNWFYVGSPYTIPSVDAIKNAIYNYGPVSVALCAGPVFSSYSGGIYSTNESSSCTGSINHAVDLVGWNDAENTWILRNSWGSWWGESGYMRIARGVSNIGYNASYVVYNGSVTPQFKHFLPMVVNPQSASGWTTIMSEDFEGAFPGAWWVSDGDGTTNGEYYWGKRTCRPYAGSYSGWGVGDGLNGASLDCGSYYPNYAYSWMQYGPFSLTDTTAAELRFKLWLNTPGYPDRLSYYASIDGNYFYGYYSNPTGGWADYVMDLSNVYTLGNLLGQPNVWIAFRFYSDASTNAAEGAYLDDILLRKCPTGAICPVSSSALPTRGSAVDTPIRVTRPK